MATDNVGIVQPTPTVAQATTYLAGLPTSAVNPLPTTTTTPSFRVSWGGSPGPGATSIASYEIFVSDDGGPFTPFLATTTATSATFTDQAGHTYGFYSVATENPGLVQAAPAVAQATTTVIASTPPPPPVIVTSVRWETIKVKTGNGKKAMTKSESALEIEFNGPVAGSADLAAYQLSSVMTKKEKKKAVTTYKPIRLTLAVPTSSPLASSVSLVPATKPNLSETDRLEIVAGDLTDALGRPLNGNDDGQPGGNFAATFSKHGIAFAQPSVRLERSDRRGHRAALGP